MSNREILFRGKRVDTKEWIEGYFVIDGAGRNLFAVPNDGAPVVTFYPVISATVGQFTGLTDKNGKKIFEGDILITHGMDGTLLWQVKFYKDCLWSFEGIENPYSSVHNSVDTDGVIIGNIHDSPKLLGGEGT